MAYTLKEVVLGCGWLLHGRKFVKVLSELTGVGCGGYVCVHM